MSEKELLGTIVPAEKKVDINVNLTARFETLDEALAFVEKTKDADITSFNISQYERYEGAIPF